MITTVVGSFPFSLNKATTFKDKLLNVLGSYDPYKLAINEIISAQFNSDIDIVSDGQVRGDMLSSFTKYIPGFKYNMNSSVIVSKILPPGVDITINDINYSIKFLNKLMDLKGLSKEEKSLKGVKGIVTGPSTIVHSSRIESFYKDKNHAIIDLAHALKKEVNTLSRTGVKYIQIDEPFLSTGMVNIKVAKEAISILTDDVEIPMAIHVCGNLDQIFTDLFKFKVDIVDMEFAGNKVNIGLLEKHSSKLNNKKIGFGCIDTTLNELDNREDIKLLITKAIDIVGRDNLILDPDCGLSKVDKNIAFNKLKLMTQLNKELSW